MAYLDNSLSTYTDPDYVIDFFPTRRNGKNRGSYIIASMYNDLASSVIALQQHISGSVADFTANTPLVFNMYQHGTDRLSYVNPDFGNPGEPPYLPLSTDTDISSSLTSGTKITEAFIGAKRYNSSELQYITEGLYERKNLMEDSVGPCPVNSLVDTFGSVYRDVNFHSDVMKPTPFPATGEWYAKTSSLIYSVPRCIIGSSRASALATQQRTNGQVYMGFIPTGSTGVVQANKTVLGSGALMVGGTFWIPPDSENATLNSENTHLRRRFACYPNANSGPYYAKFQPMWFYAHVLIIGPEA